MLARSVLPATAKANVQPKETTCRSARSGRLRGSRRGRVCGSREGARRAAPRRGASDSRGDAGRADPAGRFDQGGYRPRQHHLCYANKIVADQVLGAVHQSKGIKVKNSEGKIEAPQVAAGVIYADEIKANTVMAETIYVRNLDRR
jgi:hypothetical protein